MELNLCWWNIGISPPIRSNKDSNRESIDLAKKYIKTFSLEKKLDVIAICEISEKEAIDFNELADELKMAYLDLSGQVGRIIMDFSILYEMSKLEFVSKKFLTKKLPNERSIRVGVSVLFKELGKNREITLFLSHWPSKLSQEESVRSAAAQDLRVHIDKIFEKNDTEAQFICMGDYNTEPYTEPMVNQLYATRDYHLIKKKRQLIFNPSWYLLSDKKTNNIGTYHHKSAASNRWYVLDQMMFSSSFLYGGEGCLKLDFEHLDFHKILNEENDCLDDVFFENFDHCPIFCRVSND